jgi:hypothetical protein
MKPITPQRSRGRFNYRVQSNKIKRPSKCSICQKEGRIEAHHEDYSNIEKVFWLCTSCHHKWHKIERRYGLGCIGIALKVSSQRNLTTYRGIYDHLPNLSQTQE